MPTKSSIIIVLVRTEQALAGNIQAQLELGYLYYKGIHVEQDYVNAFKWFHKAAEQGDMIAQRVIGVMYKNGHGVPQDYAKALEWLHKAAEQGDMIAQRCLGNMYYFYEEFFEDYDKALEWYHKAAEKGDAIAQKNIGIMYKNGHGVVKDYAKALEWYNKAAFFNKTQNHGVDFEAELFWLKQKARLLYILNLPISRISRLFFKPNISSCTAQEIDYQYEEIRTDFANMQITTAASRGEEAVLYQFYSMHNQEGQEQDKLLNSAPLASLESTDRASCSNKPQLS